MAELLDPQDLYDEVCKLFLLAHTADGAERLVRLADEQWPRLASRASTPQDAEMCRLTMLALVQQQAFAVARIWRARSMARFAQLGWVEGVGILLMGDAFVELARANDDYRAGRTLDVLRSSATALAVIDEVERIAYGEPSGFGLGPGSPTQPVLRRLAHEKRGFLLLIAGDLEAARTSYDRAYEAAGTHPRGRVKVTLGRLLVDYVAAADAADPTARLQLADDTERWGREAGAVGAADIAEVAEANAPVMRAGDRALLGYEIL